MIRTDSVVAKTTNSTLVADLQTIDDEFNSGSIARIIQSLPKFEWILYEATVKKDTGIADAVFLQLSRYWCAPQVSNEIRFHILRIIESGYSAFPLLSPETIKPVISRIIGVLESNDVTACTLVLRLLGCVAVLIINEPSIQYRIISYLPSKDIPLQAAAIYALEQQCRFSRLFSHGIAKRLWKIVKNPLSTLETKTHVVRVFKSLYYDKEAYDILYNGISKHLYEWDEQMIIYSTESLTQLCLHSRANITKTLELLFSLYLNNEDNLFLKYRMCVLLKTMSKFESSSFSLNSVIDILMEFFDSTTSLLKYGGSNLQNVTLHELMILLRQLCKSEKLVIEFFCEDVGILNEESLLKIQKLMSCIFKIRSTHLDIHMIRTIKSLLGIVSSFPFHDTIANSLVNFAELTFRRRIIISMLKDEEKGDVKLAMKALIEYLSLTADIKKAQNFLSTFFMTLNQTTGHRLLFRIIIAYKGFRPGFINLSHFSNLIMQSKIQLTNEDIIHGIAFIFKECRVTPDPTRLSIRASLKELFNSEKFDDNRILNIYSLAHKLFENHSFLEAKEYFELIPDFKSHIIDFHIKNLRGLAELCHMLSQADSKRGNNYQKILLHTYNLMQFISISSEEFDDSFKEYLEPEKHLLKLIYSVVKSVWMKESCRDDNANMSKLSTYDLANNCTALERSLTDSSIPCSKFQKKEIGTYLNVVNLLVSVLKEAKVTNRFNIEKLANVPSVFLGSKI